MFNAGCLYLLAATQQNERNEENKKNEKSIIIHN
jgi:hypothetical protein